LADLLHLGTGKYNALFFHHLCVLTQICRMVSNSLQITAYFEQSTHVSGIFLVCLIDNRLGNIFADLFIEEVDVLFFFIYLRKEGGGTIQHRIKTQVHVFLCHLKHPFYFFLNSCQSDCGSSLFVSTGRMYSRCIPSTFSSFLSGRTFSAKDAR